MIWDIWRYYGHIHCDSGRYNKQTWDNLGYVTNLIWDIRPTNNGLQYRENDIPSGKLT